MADTSISGMYRIIPPYPIKPIKPSDKDRESNRQQPPDGEQAEDDRQRRGQDEDDNNTIIDEYV